ncbi:MAG: hypothetical protein ACXU8N_06530 [Telluria sp.]
MNESLKQALMELRLSGQRTKIARLADVLPEVELALRNGATQKAVRDVLAKNGLELTERTFECYLHRLRGRQRLRKGPLVDRATSGTATTTQPPTFDPARIEAIKRQPVDLDAFERYAREHSK